MHRSDVPIRWMRGPAAHTLHRQWYGDGTTALSLALRPLSWAYSRVMQTRRQLYRNGTLNSVEAPIPVISIGNPMVGGSGKTPISAWFIDELLGRGRKPALLHGGYAADEPQLHRRWHRDVPVIVGRDRVRSAQRAADMGCDVVVLDDGMQHLRIRRSLDVALVAADTWRGETRVLPEGPWREPPSSLSRASVIGITRRAVDAQQAKLVEMQVRTLLGQTPPIVHFALVSADWRTLGGAVVEKPVHPVVAVCAIAHPQAFAAQLTAAGVPVREVLAFPDHHEYDADDAQAISHAAHGHSVITTEKDAVKLERLNLETRAIVWRQHAMLESGDQTLAQLIDHALQ